jgi:glycosyltransferase involved in cell wall biosynthesis
MAAADRDGRRPARVLWVVDHTQNTVGNFVGLAELLPHIDRRRFEPLAVVPAAGASSAALAAHAVRVLQRPIVPSGWTLNYLRAALAFCRLLLRERIDLLYIADHARWRPADLLAARCLRVPTVVHLRAIPDPSRVLDPSLRHAQAIIGNSLATLHPLRGRLPDGRLHLVYTCVDFDRFAAPTNEPLDFFPSATPIVGFVGMFRPEKGVREFIDVARRLREARPDLRFLAVGGDPAGATRHYERDMRQYAMEHGLADVMHFTGTRTDIAALMRRMDVLVVPSHTEGFGRVLIEANAVGRAVVASAVGAIPEVVEDGVTGVLVPAGDTAVMAAAVLRVLDDPVWRAAVAAQAPARVRARFSPTTQVPALEAVWQHVLKA